MLGADGTLSHYQKAEDGLWHAYCLTQAPSPWYNNQTYVDTLSKEAMDAFIRITHERYREVVGEDFDGTVPAIFTDEPQFERKETLKFALEDGEVTLPWTADVPETYAAAYDGADITQTIPELIWELPDGKIHRPDIVSTIISLSVLLVHLQTISVLGAGTISFILLDMLWKNIA